MPNSKNAEVLSKVAHEAMIARGFAPGFTDKQIQEVQALASHSSPCPTANLKDLRHLLWFSIDNPESLDLDQLTYAPNKNLILVAIADVDCLVKKGSAIDEHAAFNTTSVYTPTKVFPMLPEQLSEDLTSLKQGVDREAMVVEVEVNNEGKFSLKDTYLALVHNRAKLSYNRVADWLDENVGSPGDVGDIEGLPQQIKLQERIARRIRDYRYRQGALSFGLSRIQPIISQGAVVGFQVQSHNRAQAIIENLMIAANVAVTEYVKGAKLPILRRAVRQPKRWDRIVTLVREYGGELSSEPDGIALRNFLLVERKKDPVRYPDLSLAIIKLIGRGEYLLTMPGEPAIGHFDLGLLDYAHTTAPNRRYPDLIMQRLVKIGLAALPLTYTKEELVAIASRCSQKEDDAMKVERQLSKSAAAMIMIEQIGRQFPAIITGASHKGTWVRLLNQPIEGKLVKGSESLDVGDYLTVRLVYVDILKGFIDFEKV